MSQVNTNYWCILLGFVLFFSSSFQLLKSKEKIKEGGNHFETKQFSKERSELKGFPNHVSLMTTHYNTEVLPKAKDVGFPDGAAAAAAAAGSLQSCPTLCDPRDGLLPGSSVPGILQARTLEWVAMSFSNARKWKVKVKSLSPTLNDLMDCSPPGSSVHGIFQARVLEWGATAFSARWR